MKEHRPTFQKIAGCRQIVIKTVQDLASAVSLDPAHWAVTGMPLDAVIFDPDFLELMDTDHNNRIRPDELRNAVNWLLGILKDPSGIEEGSPVLKLSAINPEAEGATVLLSAARIILKNLGTPESDELTLEQVTDRRNLVLNSCGNGDGVITAENNDNPLLAEYVRDAITVCGSVTDVSGLPGIDVAIAEKFRKELEKYFQWHSEEKGEVLFPYGERTPELYEKYIAVEEILNHYFFLCNAVAGSGTDRFSGMTSFDPLNSSAMKDFLKNAPCAMPDPERILSLSGWINPEMGSALIPFSALAHELGLTAEAECITENEWKEIVRKLLPRKEWLARTPEGAVNTLSCEKVNEYLEKNITADALALIEKDAAVKEEIEAYGSLRKLIHYQRGMIEFVNNFINLSALFNPEKFSILQFGHLIMDGRHYTLCCKVPDVAAHKKIIMRCNVCVMYVALTTGKPDALKKMTLAVAVTSGTMRDIFIGRPGVFISNDGVEWDATVIDFVQQPVSLWEAIQMPFIRFGEFLEKQADKFFTSKSKAMETDLSKDLTKGKVPGEIVQTATKQQTPAVSGSMMLMGGGIGIAALGSAFVLIVNTVKDIPVWKILTVLIGIIFVVSGPVILISVIKLCRRYISDFLSAGGWAVNPRMRLSNRMGMIFTHIPDLPAGIRYLYGDLIAKFSKNFIDKRIRKRKIIFWICFALVLLGTGAWIYWKYFKH